MSSINKTSKRGTSRGSSSEGVHDDILVPKVEFMPHSIDPSENATWWMARIWFDYSSYRNVVLCHEPAFGLERCWGRKRL
ncbi:hypothetical protein F2Q69_00015191 [Brassica cretica]|uniref:Uncharacterized protein n=1 Tax=Brassica cretica TaxID=69181 RepID=A0A8S9R0U3_BRACR|nr:hypothetical protein F2Q69_00015191 [Brassica cretica]